MLSRLYGAVAARRRRWYDRDPAARRRLDRPVVSVGALTVGGSGKTPIAAQTARILLSLGERPAVLSRGYGREHRVDGVVVVRDREAIRADVATAGDEPMMLARALPDIPVLVSEDRYLAGRLAETRLGATVHVLDDGFQHLSLHRDVDLVALSERDLDDPQTLPGGRLRETLDTAGRADALIVETSDPEVARRVGDRLGVATTFHFQKVLRTPLDPRTGQGVEVAPQIPVVAVAGIARPQAFFVALRDAGYSVVGSQSYRDHHRFTVDDIASIERLADTHRAEYVVTTDKDFERLLPHAPFRFQILSVPLAVDIEPGPSFRAWISERLGSLERGAR